MQFEVLFRQFETELRNTINILNKEVYLYSIST